MRRIQETGSGMERYCTSIFFRESTQLTHAVESDRSKTFLRCGTNKEALFKTTGESLSPRLESFDASTLADESTSVTRYTESVGQPCLWHIQHIKYAHFTGAVAICAARSVSVIDHGYWNLVNFQSVADYSLPHSNY